MIKVESDELGASFSENGEITSNIQQRPYGEQSLIILGISDTEILFSFEIAKSKKKVILLKQGDTSLNYCFQNAEGFLEFIYSETGENRFYFEKTGTIDNLSFSNEDARYTIYNSPSKMGVKVFVKGKEYDMKGILLPRAGNISETTLQSFDNVIIE